jgi:hypothetical protein
MRGFDTQLRLAMASALLFTMSTLLEHVRAEEDDRISNDIVLADVRVSPVKPGGRAQIKFVLDNRSAERILFGGIMVTGARGSRIVASLGNGATTTLDSIPVAPGEVLSADGEAHWVEVDGLPSARSGMIEAKLRFGSTAVPISLSATCQSKPSS